MANLSFAAPSLQGCWSFSLPVLNHSIDMIPKLRQLLNVAPRLDEIRIIASRRVLNIPHAHSDGHTSADAGDKSMLLRETWQLVEKCARTQSCRMSQETLVRFVCKPVSNNRPALCNDGFTEFTRPLTR